MDDPARTRRRVIPSDELLGEPPSGVEGLQDQAAPLDHERTILDTRTAAPEQAPQSLNVCVRVGERVAQSAALAAATTAVKAAASVTARSASDLRSTSIPAAFSPAMNRL